MIFKWYRQYQIVQSISNINQNSLQLFHVTLMELYRLPFHLMSLLNYLHFHKHRYPRYPHFHNHRYLFAQVILWSSVTRWWSSLNPLIYMKALIFQTGNYFLSLCSTAPVLLFSYFELKFHFSQFPVVFHIHK